MTPFWKWLSRCIVAYPGRDSDHLGRPLVAAGGGPAISLRATSHLTCSASWIRRERSIQGNQILERDTFR